MNCIPVGPWYLARVISKLDCQFSYSAVAYNCSRNNLHIPRISCWKHFGSSAKCCQVSLNADTEKSCESVRPYEEIPMRKGGYPIIGHLLDAFNTKLTRRFHEYQMKLHEENGKMFRTRMASLESVTVGDPEIAEDVFRQQGKNPSRMSVEPWVYYKKINNYQQGLVTLEGQHWSRHRSVLNKQMLRKPSLVSYAPRISDIAEDLLGRLDYLLKQSEDRTVPDLTNELYKWAMESVANVLFENRLGCLNNDVPEDTQRFINAVQNMFETMLPTFFFTKLQHRIGTKSWKKFSAAFDTIFEISEKNISRRLAELEASENKNVEVDGASFLGLLLADDKLTLAEMVSNVTDLFLAGVDTTSNNLTFMLYEIAKCPRVQDRLEQELRDVLPGGRRASYEDLAKLRYVKCAFKESQRLYPIVVNISRVMDEDCVIGGYRIPKNTPVILSNYVMSRDPNIFPRVDEFLPERWLRGDQHRLKDLHPFASLPFGYGVRNCVGRRLAEMEVQFATARILQHYRLSVIEGKTLDATIRGLLVPTGPVPIKFEKRDKPLH